MCGPWYWIVTALPVENAGFASGAGIPQPPRLDSIGLAAMPRYHQRSRHTGPYWGSFKKGWSDLRFVM
jgi:hypothetical protein